MKKAMDAMWKRGGRILQTVISKRQREPCLVSNRVSVFPSSALPVSTPTSAASIANLVRARPLRQAEREEGGRRRSPSYPPPQVTC